MKCERQYCGHSSAVHDREYNGSTTTCQHCPCPFAIVGGEPQRRQAAPATAKGQYALVDVDKAAPEGDRTVVTVAQGGRTVYDSDAEKEAILAGFDAAPEYFERLRRARQIAFHLARERGTVTVAEVREKFCLAWGAEAWADEHGSTYWAGAIFRDRETWEACGTTKSPYNHNDSNRVWKLVARFNRSPSEDSSSAAKSSGASDSEKGNA